MTKVGDQRLFLGSCSEVLPSLGARYGFVVADPFCGSASSGVAAKELGLAWDGIEQDAITARIAAERLGRRVRLFSDTVVRRRAGESLVYLMNRQRRGWGEYAIPHKSIEEIEVFYAVSVGDWARDEHGEFAPVELALSVDAVDPQVANDKEPSTREKGIA